VHQHSFKVTVRRKDIYEWIGMINGIEVTEICDSRDAAIAKAVDVKNNSARLKVAIAASIDDLISS